MDRERKTRCSACSGVLVTLCQISCTLLRNVLIRLSLGDPGSFRKRSWLSDMCGIESIQVVRVPAGMMYLPACLTSCEIHATVFCTLAVHLLAVHPELLARTRTVNMESAIQHIVPHSHNPGQPQIMHLAATSKLLHDVLPIFLL